MAEEHISNLTKKSVSAANKSLNKSTTGTVTSSRQSGRITQWGDLLVIASVVGAALLSTSHGYWVQWMENQVVNTFFQLRGSVVPPEDIIILAIDDQSISIPEQYYKTNPQQYAYLEPLKSFPYKRATYAQVIEKLMQVGVRSVALDVVFDTPSSYGAVDDSQMQTALQKYGDKVTLAALYENSETIQGSTLKLTQPQELFRTDKVSIGLVNFPVEVDGKIHRLAREYPKLLGEDMLTTKLPAFEEAVLKSAQVKYPPPKGGYINFYGVSGTFPTIPLWYVFDPDNWNHFLQQGKVFTNKIVLIGSTAKLNHDDHAVAISQDWWSSEKMPGVEIHANAIATLMTGKAITPAIQTPLMIGLFVLFLVGSSSGLMHLLKGGIQRFLASLVFASLWGGISLICFVYGQLIFPTSIPMMAIALNGFWYLTTEVVREKINKRQLLLIFQKYQSDPVVQEIINLQDDLQQLIKPQDLDVIGRILSERYQIMKVLGSGGFSETYIAEDIQRPGHPQCVVKQLKLSNPTARSLELARRFFESEAQTLEKLGKHPQIPQLLAAFEEDGEFYLIQEYIAGHPLSKELKFNKILAEKAVIMILKDLLQIILFVHENGVIHRDIKPSNIIRRYIDWKLVLIDFGAVKEVTTQQLENPDYSAFTIGIGTKGYAPSEQCLGHPHYNSDIYAIGMIGIKALTGINPHELSRDDQGEVSWINQALVSESLVKIINKMVLDDYKKRYQSASEVLVDLNKLMNFDDVDLMENRNILVENINLVDADSPTTPWVGMP